METVDKIGRDLAKEFDLLFKDVIKGDPERLKIMHNTKIYQYFAGKVEHHFPGNKWPWVEKIQSAGRLEILLPLQLKSYLNLNVITQEEYDSCTAMINSPDKENLTVVECMCDAKYRPRYLKLMKKYKNL